ncbi:MAG: hypothetical protein IJ574_00470 [Bacilli bacterium]|nr:hypothetical protein [Bacilli bacterium]
MWRICPYYRDDSTFLNTKNTCLVTGEEVKITNNYYYDYCRNEGYKCPLYEKEFPKSNCFITTITCEILNKDDNDHVMQKLRQFRNNILQQNEYYYDILKEYDVIGPIITEKILQDDNKEKLAQVIYNDILLPLCKLIDDKEYELATEKYYVLTLLLINYYNLKHNYNKIKVEDYNYQNFDAKKAGHGRILKK